MTKSEEYYLEQCPAEIGSICLKFIVDMLVEMEIVSGLEDIPPSIGRLLYLANLKSDSNTERDIFG
jgi:hypothetical protein